MTLSRRGKGWGTALRKLHYLKSHMRGIAAFILMCVFAALIFVLYRLPFAAVGYAVAVCGTIGLIFLILDYLRTGTKCRKLEHMKAEILTTTDTLPEAWNTIEEEYQELLRILYEEKERLCVEQEQKYRDLVDYYSIWAHQVKTPIAAARLILESAEQAAQDGQMDQQEKQTDQQVEQEERQGEYGCRYLSRPEVQELKEELRRIEQYAEMVLCYLRLDSDSSDYVIREYDLDGIVRQAVRKNASIFIRKKLKLIYNPLQTRVVTDEKWLLFVVEQVLSNALKYTFSGSVTIALEEPKTLCIRDTGIGIAREDLPRIFERGYTGGNGRTDKKASGIGLYLCRRICRNLGHEITAVSQPGAGTEIRIDLKNAELEIE